MKRHGQQEHLNFRQRKQRRIKEQQPDDKIVMFVYDGCTIPEMRIWGWLNWQQTQVRRTECLHSPSREAKPTNISRISKRGEAMLLACDCNNTTCPNHEKNKKQK